MARERDKAEWNRISSVVASIRNAFRSDGKATQPGECTPYGSGQKASGTGVPLRKENLQMLRQLTKGHRR